MRILFGIFLLMFSVAGLCQVDHESYERCLSSGYSQGFCKKEYYKFDGARAQVNPYTTWEMRGSRSPTEVLTADEAGIPRSLEAVPEPTQRKTKDGATRRTPLTGNHTHPEYEAYFTSSVHELSSQISTYLYGELNEMRKEWGGEVKRLEADNRNSFEALSSKIDDQRGTLTLALIVALVLITMLVVRTGNLSQKRARDISDISVLKRDVIELKRQLEVFRSEV